MEINPIDPRDVQWEVHHPAYRVYFWSKTEDSPGRPAWSASEFEVTGADLEATDVISWAREQAKQRTLVVIYALVDGNNGGPGLVRLAGYGPNLDAQSSTFQVQADAGAES